MARQQLHAGYVLGSVRDALMDAPDASFYNHLLQQLSVFDIETSQEGQCIDIHSVFAVADNIISRGLPTVPSVYVEQRIAEALQITEQDINQGSISFPFRSPLKDVNALARLMAVIDPRIPPVTQRYEQGENGFGSDLERSFYSASLPGVAPFLPQLTELQRPLSTIIDPEAARNHLRQRVDFAIEFPRYKNKPRGLVIELDGRHHHDDPQEHLDRRRDYAIQSNQWSRVVRIRGEELHHQASWLSGFQEFLDHPYAQWLSENYSTPVWETEYGRIWLQAVLVPFGIARIQKVLSHLILTGQLDLTQSGWSIAIVERDLPCAAMAIRDFQQLIQSLVGLSGDTLKLPVIELSIYRTSEFIDFELAQGDDAIDIKEAGKRRQVDAIIDVALLQRCGFSELSQHFLRLHGDPLAQVRVRTAYSPRSARRIQPGKPIHYQWPGYEYPDAESKVDPGPVQLRYMLKNIFRKVSFREKQVDIIREALQGRSVIGLLPTGAGKSLTYQLSALLQPGCTIVVAPLKSLMRDQHSNLMRLGIDSTVFINSELATKERKKAEEGLKAGAFQFAFVSPERYMIVEYRNTLQQMEVPIQYCVVDEAHCVSEWGHDFRTPYLSLGRNVRAFGNSLWENLPILALTGTASFDVLADIRRELEFTDAVLTVTPSKLEREELQFEIRPVPPTELRGNPNEWDIKQAVFEMKKRVTSNLLRQMAESDCSSGIDTFFALRGKSTNSGLVFTPHANHILGVQTVAAELERDIPSLFSKTGGFASSDDSQEDEDLIQTQEKFKQNELSLLVATKAFGMGIDKPNIRYTIHLNMPQSIESYYQEAGRAGRDRKKARCLILYSRQHKSEPREVDPANEEDVTVDRDVLQFFYDSAFKGAGKEKRIVMNLMEGEARPEDGVPDLMALLNDMSPGDLPRQVTIDFANHWLVEQMYAFLKNVDPRFTIAMVKNACEKVLKPSDFPGKLSGQFKNRYNIWPRYFTAEEKKWLESSHHYYRNKNDTFKAIYRLSLVGIIDGYTIDYNAGVVRADIIRRPDSEYIEHVQQYISRYVSHEQKLAVPERVGSHTGENIYQKCLGTLIDFVYETIAVKRLNAINVMEEAVQEGAKNGSQAFTQRVNTYFDSRYTPQLEPYSLEYDLDLVWKFMEDTEGLDDNVRHLRGACDRLLSSYPSNAAYLLLRSFTRCILDESASSAFISDFRSGWALFQQKGLPRRAYLNGLSTYAAIILQFDSRLERQLETEVVAAHSDWLHNFNQEFLKDYGSFPAHG